MKQTDRYCRVLVRNTNRVLSTNGVDIKLDQSYEPYKHQTVFGEVVTPAKGMDVIEGDIVYFHYLSVPNAKQDNMIEEVEGGYIVPIIPPSLILRKRGNQITCLNDYILILPEEGMRANLVTGIVQIPDHVLKDNRVRIGIVAVQDRLGMYKQGQKVLYRKSADVPLEYDIRNNLTDKKEAYWRLQVDRILATLNE